MAWEIDFNQQSLDKGTDKYVQTVSQHSKTPIRVFKDRPTLKGQPTNAIALQKLNEALLTDPPNDKKNSMLLWLGILSSIIAVIIGLIVLLNMQ